MLRIGLLATAASATTVPLVTFDGSTPTYTWRQMNDPVMGGRSTGTWSTNQGVGVMSGKVAIVPFLGGPGFIKAATPNRAGSFPDVSSCAGIALEVMSNVPYDGYRFSFGTDRAPGGGRFASGYKADFNAPVGTYGTIMLPWDSFSTDWDEATGDQVTTCPERPVVCPTAQSKRDLKTLGVWGEGVEGDVVLSVKSIYGYDCGASGGTTAIAAANWWEQAAQPAAPVAPSTNWWEPAAQPAVPWTAPVTPSKNWWETAAQPAVASWTAPFAAAAAPANWWETPQPTTPSWNSQYDMGNMNMGNMNMGNMNMGNMNLAGTMGGSTWNSPMAASPWRTSAFPGQSYSSQGYSSFPRSFGTPVTSGNGMSGVPSFGIPSYGMGWQG